MILCVDLKFLLMVDGLLLQKTVTKKEDRETVSKLFKI